MRTSFLVLGLLLVAPVASAHIALTVKAPTAPLKPFATTGIDVDAAAECADMVAQFAPPAFTFDRDLALSASTPAGLKWTGETMTFKGQDCLTGAGSAPSSGTLLVTPNGTLPAFTDLALQVVCTDCEGGGFVVQVGYYANVTATAPAGIKTGTPFTVLLNVSTNHDTDLSISIKTPGAKATLASFPSQVRVDSPLIANQTSRLVPIQLQASGPASGWTTDQIVLSIAPAAHNKTGNGTAGTTTTLTLPIANGAPPGSTSTSTSASSHSKTTSTSTSASKTSTSHGNATSSVGKKDSAAASPFLALAVVGVALAVLRRRTE